MRPINAFEIKKSYKIFILNFSILTLFSIFCIFLFFAASDHEYALLEKKVQETEKLSSLRKEINSNLDHVLVRFRELSKYQTYNADDLSRQTILLDDIQNTNFKIKELISQKPKASISFDFYEKINNNIASMATLQDSLHDSRYTIESYREQLNDCLRSRRATADRIGRGRFGR
jgi:hypothetical protein